MITLSEAHSSLNTFPDNNLARLTVYSYLDGATLFHKIALLNRLNREQLPEHALLDQIIQISIKSEYSESKETPPTKSFIYAVRLADCI
jgi:hypothetical protein